MRVFVVPLFLAACSPMPELHFNEPPGAPTFHIEPASPTTSDPLVVTMDADAVDPEGDDLNYDYTWYADGVEQFSGSKVLDPAFTVRGQVWEVVGTATDGEFVGEEARATVVIGNSLPEISTLTLSPTAPDTEDDLVLAAAGTDLDGDLVGWSVTWTRGGEEQSAYADSLIVPAAATGSLEDWTAVVAPTDGYGVGAEQSVSVYIDNTVPAISGLRLLPNAPTVDDSIYATLSDIEDPDQPGQTVAVTFTWYVDGAEVFSETDTDGNSYLTEGFVKGSVVTVTAMPFDGYAWGDPLSSDPITVVNTPPVLDSATLSPTTGYEATEFTCSPGTSTDADGDRVDYDYTWYVNGTALGTGSDTIDGDSFDKGDEIYCVITPDDRDDSGDPVTSGIATVLNTVPVITAVSISPTTPTVALPLTAAITGASDADGDAISYTYAWTVNGAATGASINTLSNSSFVRGDSVQLTVTPSDGAAGSPVTSSAVVIDNALPSLSSASITPSSAYNDDNLSVSVSGWYDADGDSAGYTYQWYENGIALTGQTSSTLSASYTTKGERFYCAVTPNDGIDNGTVRNTSTITILNSAPDTVADATTGLTATECDTIELDASGSSDEDGDTLTYTWALSSKPSGSLASTSDIDATSDEMPSFVVDYAGSFIFSLAANDGSQTATDTVTITVYDAAANVSPVSVPDAIETTVTQTTGCSSSSSGSYVCTPCTGSFYLDASASYDDDEDPLHYTWSTTSPYGSLSSSTSSTPTLTMRNMPASHGTTLDYQVTVSLRVQDCAGNTDTEDLVLTYSCTGL